MPVLGRTALAAGLLLSSIACFPRVSLANASCPCAPGHTCCADTQTCVAEGQGCASSYNALSAGPLSVQVTWPLAISRPRGSGPVDVHFRVNGCDDFTVESVYDSPAWPSYDPEKGPRHLPVTADPTENAYVAHLNFGDFDKGCNTRPNVPFDGDVKLKATCADGRSALSSSVPLQFATTASSGFYVFPGSQVWPLEKENHVLVVGPDTITTLRPGPSAGWDFEHWQYVSVSYAGSAPFAQHGDNGYLAVGCPLVDCGKTVLPNGAGEAPTTYVYVLDLSDELDVRAPLVKDVITVAGRVQDLIPDPDGSVGVVGSVSDEDDPYLTGVVVSRIHDKTATVQFYWPKEVLISLPPTRHYVPMHHDVFATMAAGAGVVAEDIRIHSLYTDETFTLALPEEERVENRPEACTAELERWGNRMFHPDLYFAPGGREWLLHGCTTQLGSPNKPWAKLEVDTDPLLLFPPVWTNNSIVMMTAGDKVEFVARTDQHERLFTYVAERKDIWPPRVTADGQVLLHHDTGTVHFLDDFGTSLGTLNIGQECSNRDIIPLNGNLLGLMPRDVGGEVKFLDASAASKP